MASTVSDNLVWAVIGQKCAHQVANRTDNSTLCNHPMNVDGQCNFLYCPLANSQYACVTEEEGLLYLNMKTAERKHLPNKWWEKIPLPKVDGEELIEEKLKYFVDEKLLKRNIERYHRLQEIIDRIRILRSESRSRIVAWDKRVERRMRNREKKAILAARLNDKIENELLNRLQMGVYGELYDGLAQKDARTLAKENEIAELRKQVNELRETEFEEAEENTYQELEDMTGYVSEGSSVDDDDIEDVVGQFEFADWEARKRKIKLETKQQMRKRRRVEIEYEEEREDEAQHN